MATLTLASLTESDLPQAMDLERRTYSTPWSERVFLDELEAPGRTYIKATAGGVLVGYAGLMMVADEAHITTVVVDAGHRGGGVGTRLVLELVGVALADGAHSLTLEVRVSNRAAQALYRRFGMSPDGVRKKYYVDEDALIMWAHDIDSEAYAERLAEIRDSLG
jgi:ribosomal-protein-alanine N-acetyltransferase